MKRTLAACFVLSVLLPTFAGAQQDPQAADPLATIDWIQGPGEGPLGDLATIAVPEGFIFTGADGTRAIMEMMQNPVSGTELGLVAPAETEWFVVFEFADIGYVKDDEQGDLDPDAILESLQEGNRQGNEERRRRGWPTLELEGWASPPHYDPATNNLEWATRLRSDDGVSINYNTRLLGREGVMSATLVVGPEILDATLPAFKTLLGGYGFTSGHRYAEYRKGDKIAKYGLTALITGGALAAAAKTGLLKKFWKLIVVAFAGLATLLRKVFGGGKKAETPSPSGS